MNSNGCCDWHHHDSVALELPRFDRDHDYEKNGGSAFPDILVHLYTGKSGVEMMPICFARIKVGRTRGRK